MRKIGKLKRVPIVEGDTNKVGKNTIHVDSLGGDKIVEDASLGSMILYYEHNSSASCYAQYFIATNTVVMLDPFDEHASFPEFTVKDVEDGYIELTIPQPAPNKWNYRDLCIPNDCEVIIDNNGYVMHGYHSSYTNYKSVKIKKIK